MTAIVGLVHGNDVYLGGDSAGVSGLSLTIRDDTKVFSNGQFIFGFTSSYRMGQLLRYKFSPPVRAVGQNDMEYMVTSFIDSVRMCFVANGFGEEKSSLGSLGGCFLVGYNGHLYNIEADYQVGIPHNQYDAVGCGTDLCLGAMFATEGLDPETRINAALMAAANFSAGVSPPFTILKLEGEKPPEAKKAKTRKQKKTKQEPEE